MKKLLAASLLLFLSTPLAFPAVSIRLVGGMSYLLGHDYNKGVQGLYNYYLDNYDGVTGKFKPLQFGLNVEAELAFPLGRTMAVGLGAAYLRFARDSEFGYQMPYFSSRDSLKPDMRLMPLFLNVHFYVPGGPRLRTDWFVGAGYYMLKFDHAWSVQTDFFSYQSEQTFQARKAGLGVQGGVGIEFEISPRVALLFHVSGRLVKFSNLKGRLEEKVGSLNVSWESVSDEAYFWFYGLAENNAAYAQISFSQTKPSEAEYSGIRHGILDLSGITAGIGLKFVF